MAAPNVLNLFKKYLLFTSQTFYKSVFIQKQYL